MIACLSPTALGWALSCAVILVRVTRDTADQWEYLNSHGPLDHLTHVHTQT